MLLSGRELADGVLALIQTDIEALKQKGVTPKIVIITVGGEETWKAYVGQKQKMAEKLGIAEETIHLSENDEQKLLTTLEKLNDDPNVHGIIVQRPVPKSFDRERITNTISKEKDIDGFRDDSDFQSPIWLAILLFLQYVYKIQEPDRHPDEFMKWLHEKTWTVVGKGETGGRPTIIELGKMKIEPHIIDSKTQNPDELIKHGNIVISGVGKPIINASNIKPGAILIGIGIRRGEDGKLYGDYNESQIEPVAGYYTPTPGGVGPLNLAFLFKNLITAAKKT